MNVFRDRIWTRFNGEIDVTHQEIFTETHADNITFLLLTRLLINNVNREVANSTQLEQFLKNQPECGTVIAQMVVWYQMLLTRLKKWLERL